MKRTSGNESECVDSKYSPTYDSVLCLNYPILCASTGWVYQIDQTLKHLL